MLKKQIRNNLLLIAITFFCYFFSTQSFGITIIQLRKGFDDNIQTLDYVVKQTLLNNPNILESQAQLNAARYALREVRGEYAPRLDARVMGGRDNNRYSDFMKTETTANEMESSLYVVQPIFTGFSTKNLARQRTFEIKSAAYNEAYVKEQLALQAVSAYHEVMRTYRLQIIAQNNVKKHREVLRKEQLRYNGGGGNKVDVDLAKTRLSQSLDYFHQIERLHEDGRAFYLKIVGISSGKLQLAKLPKVPDDLKKAQNLSLEYNPAILSMKESINSAASAVSVTKSSLLPQVNLEVASINNYNSSRWQANRYKEMRGLVVVDYNLFKGGSNIAAIEKAKQNKVATIEKTNAVQRDVLESVTKAWDALQSDTKRVIDLTNRVSSAKEVLNGYKKQFEYSRRSLLDVLDEENELFNAQLELCSATYALRNDHYALLASMGALTSQFSK